MSDKKRIRIRLYGQHLAYIGIELYDKFLRNCKVLDYSAWVKEKSYTEYGILITDEDSINRLKEKVVEDDFEDVADWLRENMRKDMRSKGV